MKKEYIGKKTLIFDLDETLVHCEENISHEVPDHIYQWENLNGQKQFVNFLLLFVFIIVENLYQTIYQRVIQSALLGF